MTDGDGDEERGSAETDGDGVSTGGVDGDADESVLSDPVEVIAVGSSGLAVVVVAVVVVDCPFL